MFHSPIVALIYGSDCDPGPVMRNVVTRLRSQGLKCVGFVQRDVPRPGRSRCDMVLEDMTSGEPIAISQDRGPEARGCRLDENALAEAIVAAQTALDDAPDVLLINKFGKSEAEGRGFRPLIADALERGVPVVIAVPWRNIEGWRLFAGEMSCEVELSATSGEAERICRLLGLGATPSMPATRGSQST